MKILLATDGSEFSDAAIEKFGDFVLKPGDTEIKILSVYERLRPLAGEPFGVSNEYYQQAENASKRLADEAVKKAADALRVHFPGSAINLTTNVEPGRPAKVIVETAEDWKADIILMGSHGHGFWARNMIGSVSDGVVHHAPCSVMIVRKPSNGA